MYIVKKIGLFKLGSRLRASAWTLGHCGMRKSERRETRHREGCRSPQDTASWRSGEQGAAGAESGCSPCCRYVK